MDSCERAGVRQLTLARPGPHAVVVEARGLALVRAQDPAALALRRLPTLRLSPSHRASYVERRRREVRRRRAFEVALEGTWCTFPVERFFRSTTCDPHQASRWSPCTTR